MTRHDRKLEKAIRPLFADPITVIHFLWELNIFFCFQIPTSIPKNNKPTLGGPKTSLKPLKLSNFPLPNINIPNQDLIMPPMQQNTMMSNVRYDLLEILMNGPC